VDRYGCRLRFEEWKEGRVFRTRFLGGAQAAHKGVVRLCYIMIGRDDSLVENNEERAEINLLWEESYH
jgi:hypothetical protein